MRVLQSTPPPKTTVLLFGPHFLTFDLEHFLHLRSTVSDLQYQWIHTAVSELPEWWDTASQALPILTAVPGSSILRAWDDSFKPEQPVVLSFPLPNIILAPLLVITQLAQYTHHLRLSQAESLSIRKETVGFCTGLLAATAVASPATIEQLERYGAVAIRLAMLIGALVDAADTPAEMGESVSYSIAWNSAESARDMEQILKKDSEAYLSVLSDNKRATLTTSRNTSALLVQTLRAVGISVTEIGLRGRFHSHRYANYIDAIHHFCDSHAAFQFPDALELVLPTRSNIEPGYTTNGKPHNVAIESILLHQCRWYQTITSLSADLANSGFTIVSFGIERSIPPSLMPALGPKVIYASELASGQPQSEKREISDSNIAVIGMACKLPGADDLEEFWQLLCEGPSQHQEVPPERMAFKTTWRQEDPKKKWYGDFIRDYDTFDHTFFKKSPREAAAMDPQQRLMLQTAYQAVAQSGYFTQNVKNPQIGCYIGVSNVDYENNVACYPANAYTATGTLKSFVAGKVSHYFGWTGPALTVDTACSAAAVALHQACQGILSGDCTEALAGDVNIMASPLWYRNLAGASFLSPTGPCKPFDARADGYCRGEGCGAVFLKKDKAAVADRDQIFGIIAGTAVQQNENCTPITVPNSPSLSDLFQNVLSKANVAPRQISVVEAHGTGTAVGDPAEYESIRRVLGGSVRSDLKPLALGSVKSVVGHLECASGIVALLKVLLMLNKKTVPPQIGFESINPAIKATPADKMTIHTQASPWSSDFRAALINNYGASGSNASLVVIEAPSDGRQAAGALTIRASLKRYPFRVSALDQSSLQAYSARLLQHVRSHEHSLSVDQLSFHLCRQSNRLLGHSLIFSCGNIEELKHKLSDSQAGTIPSTERQLKRPVILCFGGQVSTSISLNREIFDSVAILRSYLDECNAVCKSANLDVIYPDIFQKSPIQDTVKLQICLFAMQYACAKAWIACGVQVAAVVGHSFGELTSLCVSGALSLRDAIKLVAGRARIVRDSWGSDKGGMMAVEGDLPQIQRLLEVSNQTHAHGQAVVACVNGPQTWLDCALCDSFCQVAGVFVNCMTDKPDKEICISTGIEQLMRSPRRPAIESPPNSFDVLAIHSRPTDKTYLSDVFIFDPRNGELLGVILGIMYQRVNKVALGKLLARLTPGMESTESAVAVQISTAPTTTSILATGHTQTRPSPREDISGKVLQLVANISGADASKIKNGTFLADLGIDSLMGMELARDVEGAFNCTFDTAQLMELTDFASLVRCINSALGIESDDDSAGEDTDNQEDQTRPAQTAVTTPEEEEVDESLAKASRSGFPSDIVHALNSKPEQDTFSRQVTVDEYVRTFSQGFRPPVSLDGSSIPTDRDVVLITGGTGSLGSHLVAHFASLANTEVICLNRSSGMDPELRQKQALEFRGLSLEPQVHTKLRVIETDTSKPLLGLSRSEYNDLASRVTHIIHNAWPMTIKRPVQGFAAQFQAMRNLADLAHQAACTRSQGTRIGFQFISSIATIGLYPLLSGQSLVPEARMTVDSTLPSGYGDAKLICEGILEKTLQQYPESFNAMVVRIGQIAGSSTTGYWNPVEHLTFLFKSSQTLNALPDFQGELSWCPVNDVAAILSELLLTQESVHQMYHIENPTRQSWPEMITMLADEMGIPRQHIIPFDQWLERMRQNTDEKENPAQRVEEFLDDHFIRMACGGVIMDTERTRGRSLRLRTTEAIQVDLIRKYVGAWKEIGLLH